jgi:hypothetical protein
MRSAMGPHQAGILWLADDCILRSELLERLVPIIERAHRPVPRPNESLQRKREA